MPLPDWPTAHGAPLFSALIRQSPEDFRVTEALGFLPSDDGEHDFLCVEKTSTNTEWLARQLAEFAGVPGKDVGFSGLKDRHAVTQQWFSVPRWHSPQWQNFSLKNVRILDISRNAKKLRRGSHKTNRFEIVLRKDGMSPLSNDDAVRRRLQCLQEYGVPNYFGPQRFGRNASNLALADRWAAGRRLPRARRSLAISAARSYLFNETLAARVSDGSWNQLAADSVANLDGSGSVFAVNEVDDALLRRCDSLDIHPTASLWGLGAATDMELSADSEQAANWRRALQEAGVKAAERSLRLRVAELDWEFAAENVTLRFELTRGAFATAVLREIADCRTSFEAQVGA